MTVTKNTCPKFANGVASGSTTLTRAGTTLAVTIGSDTLTLQVQSGGNNLTTTSINNDNSFCKNALTNITGALAYPNSFAWEYDLTVTQISGCSAF